MLTRTPNCSTTSLDVFITDIGTQELPSGAIAADISDYLPIFIIPNKDTVAKSRKETYTISFQDVHPCTYIRIT